MGVTHFSGSRSQRVLVLDGPAEAGAPLVEALRHHIEVDLLSGSMVQAWRAAGDAVRDGGFDLVHVTDPALALVALRVKARTPVTVAIDHAGFAQGSPLARLGYRMLSRLDEAFVSDPADVYALRERAPRLAAVVVPKVAMPLATPHARSTRAVTRALRGIAPGQLVVGVPWSEESRDLRWFRDAVLPYLGGPPVCLLFGAPSTRAARRALGHLSRAGRQFRVLAGALNVSMIAATARCIDAFVVPWPSRPANVAGRQAMLLAMATSGAPVVVAGSDGAAEHEQNALVVPGGDARALITIATQLLSMPPIQRHMLGQEFAAHSVARWPVEEAAAAYASRFKALLGQPEIPQALRAA